MLAGHLSGCHYGAVMLSPGQAAGVPHDQPAVQPDGAATACGAASDAANGSPAAIHASRPPFSGRTLVKPAFDQRAARRARRSPRSGSCNRPRFPGSGASAEPGRLDLLEVRRDRAGYPGLPLARDRRAHVEDRPAPRRLRSGCRSSSTVTRAMRRRRRNRHRRSQRYADVRGEQHREREPRQSPRAARPRRGSRSPGRGTPCRAPARDRSRARRRRSMRARRCRPQPDEAGHRRRHRGEARDELADHQRPRAPAHEASSLCRTHESGEREIRQSVAGPGGP